MHGAPQLYRKQQGPKQETSMLDPDVRGLSRKHPATHYEKRRHLLKIQDTRNIVHRQWHFSPLQSWHPGTSHSSLICADCSPYTFNARRCSACCRPSRTWVTLTDSQPSLKPSCHTCIWAALTASLLKAFWIIPIVSVEECSSLRQDSMQICCPIRSFWMQRPHSTHAHSMASTIVPHWLVQWRCPCSHTHIPVHSPWLPGYIDVVQSPLIVLTMARLFLDRPRCTIENCDFTKPANSQTTIRGKKFKDTHTSSEMSARYWRMLSTIPLVIALLLIFSYQCQKIKCNPFMILPQRPSLTVTIHW